MQKRKKGKRFVLASVVLTFAHFRYCLWFSVLVIVFFLEYAAYSLTMIKFLPCLFLIIFQMSSFYLLLLRWDLSTGWSSLISYFVELEILRCVSSRRWSLMYNGSCIRGKINTLNTKYFAWIISYSFLFLILFLIPVFPRSRTSTP